MKLCQQIINQIDERYISALIHIPAEETNFLVLFDQHAVDERIKLEALMKGDIEKFSEVKDILCITYLRERKFKVTRMDLN